MTTHDHFHAAIDAAPGDMFPLLQFADWLEDHGEPAQAEAWRWLGVEGKVPYRNDEYYYWQMGSYITVLAVYTLPFLVDRDLYLSNVNLFTATAAAYAWAAQQYLAHRALGWSPETKEVASADRT